VLRNSLGISNDKIEDLVALGHGFFKAQARDMEGAISFVHMCHQWTK
jgi:hypothetical protein